MNEITSQFASSFGLSPSFINIFLFVNIAFMVMVLTYRATSNPTFGFFTLSPVLGAAFVMHLVPAWILITSLVPLGLIIIGGVFNEQRSGLTSAVIGAMVAAIVGIIAYTVVNTIVGTVDVSTMPAGSTAILKLIPVTLPILVVVTVLTTVFKNFGGVSFGEGSDDTKDRPEAFTIKVTRSPHSLIITLEKAMKTLEQYLNNFDEFLGIKTIKDEKFGVNYGLSLNDKKELWVNSNDYDLYPTEKHPELDMFKVACIHKMDQTLNKSFILGRNEKGAYLRELPFRLYDKDLQTINQMKEVELSKDTGTKV